MQAAKISPYSLYAKWSSLIQVLNCFSRVQTLSHTQYHYQQTSYDNSITMETMSWYFHVNGAFWLLKMLKAFSRQNN